MSGSSGSDSLAIGQGRSQSTSSLGSVSHSRCRERVAANSTDSHLNEEGGVKSSDKDNVDSDLLVFLNKLKRPDDKAVTGKLDA